MIIKRQILKEIKPHLDQKEITLIVGPRQAGKTTLMMLLKDELDKFGRETVFLNLDIDTDRQFFTDQDRLIKKIELEIGKNGGYVFIDEIQRKENAGLFLKGLYDMNTGYKFIVSGSGSIELKEKIHESLVGRKRIFELPTVSFFEFADYKTHYAYEGKLPAFFTLDEITTGKLLEEYMNFGGYPRVILAETLEEKRRIIDEIYRSYLERDIIAFLKVEKGEVFTDLVRILAGQIGNLVNVSELSSTLGISAPTIKNYLWYLQKTYILRKVTPYFRNVRKEITKAPEFYFSDLGLRNYAAGEWGNAFRSSSAGFLFENFVHLLLYEKIAHTPYDLRFWRSKDGAEVDFVIAGADKVLPIEVKFKNLTSAEIGKSLKSFIKKYKAGRAYVVNLGFEDEVKFESTAVRFVPFFKLLADPSTGLE